MEKITIINIVVLTIGMLFGVLLNLIEKKYILNQKLKSDKNLKEVFKAELHKKNILKEVIFAINLLILFNAYNFFGLENEIAEVFNSKLITIILLPFMMIVMYLISKIDFEKRKIDKKLLMYGMLIIFAMMFFDYVLNFAIFTNAKVQIISLMIYLTLMIVAVIIQAVKINKNKQVNYILDVIIYLYILSLFFGSVVMLITIPISIAIYTILVVVKKYMGKDGNKKSKEKIKVMQTGIIAITPIISVTSIIVYTLYMYFKNYMPNIK